MRIRLTFESAGKQRLKLSHEPRSGQTADGSGDEAFVDFGFSRSEVHIVMTAMKRPLFSSTRTCAALHQAKAFPCSAILPHWRLRLPFMKSFACLSACMACAFAAAPEVTIEIKDYATMPITGAVD